MKSGVSRNLVAGLSYRFNDGTTVRFTGKPCYRLSNSYRDAVVKAEKACAEKGEQFSYENVVKTY